MARERLVSTVLSRAPQGLAAPLVRVEVHLGSGLPAFAIVGLPEAVVRESRERVRAALLSAGFDFPVARITVNLSPADLPKEGGRFDLPIAIGILTASGQLPVSVLRRREFYGELSLSGELRETRKLVPALVAGAGRGHEIIVPSANSVEAALVGSPTIFVADDLRGLCASLRSGTALTRARAIQTELANSSQDANLDQGAHRRQGAPPRRCPDSPAPDLADVRGQFAAKRALEIAAAGQHGLLFVGPPGAGKTLLAQTLAGLLPPLSADEALEVASLESAAGRRPSISRRRPFRNPQHTASVAALIGGNGFRPGELSLAHLGVLFLDELPEFQSNALEALREPLESGIVSLGRAKRTYEFPARFQLIAAMNPCPCGFQGDVRGRCRCTAQQVDRYRNRISGPLMDRIDIHLELAALPADQLIETPSHAEASAVVAARVAAAQQRQMDRQGKLNARLTARETRELCRLDAESLQLVRRAIARLGLSARAYERILKLARTVADLAGAPQIGNAQVAEAVRLRALDRAAPAATSRATPATC
jgi:magnesium chelatase family protein